MINIYACNLRYTLLYRLGTTMVTSRGSMMARYLQSSLGVFPMLNICLLACMDIQRARRSGGLPC